jgi:hypothetical protein
MLTVCILCILSTLPQQAVAVMSQKLRLECIEALKLHPDEELSAQKIKRAFNALALSVHPDKFGGDEAKKRQFQLLLEQRDRLLNDVRDGLRYSTDIALFYASGEFKCFERFGQSGGSAAAGGSAARPRQFRTAEQTQDIWRQFERNMQAAAEGPIGGAASGAAAGDRRQAERERQAYEKLERDCAEMEGDFAEMERAAAPKKLSKTFWRGVWRQAEENLQASAANQWIGGAEEEQEWAKFRKWVKMHATPCGAAAGGAGASANTAHAELERIELARAQLKQQQELLKEDLERAKRAKEALKQVQEEKRREQEAREKEAREKEAREQEAREQEAREQEAREQEAREQEAREQEAGRKRVRQKLQARERTEEEKEAYNRQHAAGSSAHNPIVFSSSSDAEVEAEPAAQDASASTEAGTDWRGADRDDAETDDDDQCFGYSRAGRRRKHTDRYRPPKPPKRD